MLASDAIQAAGSHERIPHKIYLQDETSLRELSALKLDIDHPSVDGGPSVEAYLADGSLDLRGFPIESLPKGLKVSG